MPRRCFFWSRRWRRRETGSAAQTASNRAIRIVLVGDSTVTDRSGWGYGFKLFAGDDLECVNLASGGRSSKSYIDEGKWKEALARKGDYYLIQFGHNDEPGKGPARETDPQTTFRAYMSRYIDEAREIGAQPVLVTSLTRRHFEGRTIRSTLTPYVDAVRALAAEKKVPLIDLHARSIEQVETMGEEAWAAVQRATRYRRCRSHASELERQRDRGASRRL